MTSSLLDLAGRVERLTGPCRETDLAIMQAISGHPWRWADSRTFEPQTVITWDQYSEGAPGNPFYTLEAFTESLDAAMTLVPEGCDFYFEVEQVMGGFCNYLYVTGGGSVAPSHDLRGKGGKLHPTWKEAVAALPREISAASLRVRAASEPSHG